MLVIGVSVVLLPSSLLQLLLNTSCFACCHVGNGIGATTGGCLRSASWSWIDFFLYCIVVVRLFFLFYIECRPCCCVVLLLLCLLCCLCCLAFRRRRLESESCLYVRCGLGRIYTFFFLGGGVVFRRAATFST